MAQFVVVVTVGNSDSVTGSDIENLCRELNKVGLAWGETHLEVHDGCDWMYASGDWPVTFQPLSEVIAS
jgi:hypothetical protein